MNNIDINLYPQYNFILDNFDSLDKILSLGDLLEEDNKVYVISRNIDNITNKYGKYIIDKFGDVKEVNEEISVEKVGNYDKYPKLDTKENKYYNLENIL